MNPVKLAAFSPAPPEQTGLVPSPPSAAGGAGRHGAENSFCLATPPSPPGSVRHLGAGVWNSSRLQELETRTPPFVLNLIFISGDCLHLCCQCEGHHSTATV